METLLTVLVVAALLVLAATWLVYPLWLKLRGGKEARGLGGWPTVNWPSVTLVVVVRNAEQSMRQVIQNLLSLAYPPDRRQILVVSDASRDFTDAVVSQFADKGVSLMRTTWPRGTGTAINLARKWIKSDITVVVDPAVRLRPWSLAALVAPFTERSVGVVYGRDLAAENGAERRIHETLYWRYESWLRRLETKVFGTVSARGSLYGVRTPLFRAPVPAWLNPDFAMTLTAREHGYRAVYQEDAECVVPELLDDRRAYAKAVQVISRDISTLFFKRHLLSPRRYGPFAWMLLFHKIGHWLTPWAALLGLIGLVALAPTHDWAAVMLGAALVMVLAGLFVVPLAAHGVLSRVSAPRRVFAKTAAFAHAAVRAMLEPPQLRPATFPPLPRPLPRTAPPAA
jgi:glycosyltransferase involved in cell wall biosynthesis